MKAYILSILFLLPFLGCESFNDKNSSEPSFTGAIIDTESWYSDANNDVITVNITNPIPNEYYCSPGNDQAASSRPCLIEDLNLDTDAWDTYQPILHVKMSTDTFNVSGSVMNATLNLKGGYTRFATLKSYTLKLDSEIDLFMKQRKFSLTKSESDRSRLRNKLAFDLFRIIPNISSLKVQFLHVFINNVDYGLFNHVESIRKEYLTNRGWNKDDKLYNIENFFFRNNEALKLNAFGEPLDPVAFSKVIEIKNGKNHSKLIGMINAVTTTTDIDAVIAKYFNRDNYITWLAINLVLNNKDTIQHNFYLYNPIYSDKFYILPWDYDGAWSEEQYLGKNEYGISVWWKSELPKKFLSVAKNRNDVYAMAESLRAEYITDTFIQTKITEYENSVRPFASVLPDSIQNSDDAWLNDSKRLWNSLPANIALYKSVIGHPMPFGNAATYENAILNINWDASIDLEGDPIVYDLKVSTDANLSNDATNIINLSNLEATSYSQNINLAQGLYYIQVISREKNNPQNYQVSYEQVTVNDVNLYGVLEFEVK